MSFVGDDNIPSADLPLYERLKVDTEDKKYQFSHMRITSKTVDALATKTAGNTT